jgi:DNA-binding MarR family transcriptional regulator
MGSHTSRSAASTLAASRPGDARQLLDSLRRIVGALRSSAARAEQKTGLSGAQLFALQQFRGAASLSVNQLAERTFTHQSSVSVVARRLVEAGLLRHARAAEDGRRVELQLTPRGSAIVRRSPSVAQAGLLTAVGKLEPAERRRLARGLGALADAMGVPESPATMFFEPARRAVRRGR